MNNVTSTKTILIVDDFVENLQLLSLILGEHGYKIRAAKTGRETIASIKAELPDLILLDIKLPDISGFDICKLLKIDENTSEIPVIFISALNETAEKIIGFELGAVDYITKPFENKEVLVRVKTHLEFSSLKKQLKNQAKELREKNAQLVKEKNEHFQVAQKLALSNSKLEDSKTATLNILEDINNENELRKISEEKLHITNGYLESLFNYATAPIIVWDALRSITRFNHAFENLSGYDANEVIGKKIDFLFPENKVDLSLNLICKTAIGEKWESTEIEIQKNDKSIRTVLWNSANILDKDGKTIVVTIAQGNDITERKLAEKAVLDAKEDLYLLLNSIAEGAYGVDINGNCTFVNRAFLEILGYHNPNEIIGKHIHELIHHSHSDGKIYPSVDCRMYSVLQTNKSINVSDEVFWRKDGTSFSVEYWSHPIVKNNEVIGSIATFIDITERKQAVAEIKQLNETLEQKVKIRTIQLEAAYHEMEAFSYSVSHDLRAPLRAIDGFSKILLENKQQLDKETSRILEIISQNSVKMNQLIEDLITYARVAKANISEVPINMKEIVKLVIAGVKNEILKQNIPINIAKLPDVVGDKILFSQIWYNLIRNALKFTSKNENPEIEIGGYIKENEAIFFIKDNGVGFDMKYVDKLFKVFERLHTTEQFEGTGIGLAIVKKAVSMHGGRVWAEGTEGLGASFFLALPIIKEKK